MAGRPVRTRRRTLGSLLGAGGLAVLVAAAAACGSTSPASSVATGSPVGVGTGGAGSPTSSSGTGSGTGSGTTARPPSPEPPVAASTGSAAGQGSVPVGGAVITAHAQLTAVPAGLKLVPFDSVARSSNGTTLYLGLVSQGGACGQYDVVLQQSSSSVRAGLVHLPSGTRMCPMYVGHMLVVAKLSAPLGSRSVFDLATDLPVPVSSS